MRGLSPSPRWNLKQLLGVLSIYTVVLALGDITDETVEIGLADFLTEVADFKQDWKDNENPLKSGGSQSQSGTLKEGSVGHGKSGGSKGSEQKRSNENTLKSGGSRKSHSGTLKEGSVGHGKSGGSKGSGQKRSKTNENKHFSIQ